MKTKILTGVIGVLVFLFLLFVWKDRQNSVKERNARRLELYEKLMDGFNDHLKRKQTDWEPIKIGMTYNKVLEILGVPDDSSLTDNGKEGIYNYHDGFIVLDKEGKVEEVFNLYSHKENLLKAIQKLNQNEKPNKD